MSRPPAHLSTHSTQTLLSSDKRLRAAKKKGKEKVVVALKHSFQSLKPCHVFEAVLSPREYKISLGAVH